MGYAGELLIVVVDICNVQWFLMINAMLVNNGALLLLDRESGGGERQRERERERNGERERKRKRERKREGGREREEEKKRGGGMIYS